jgi:hypothetical protein
MTMKSKGVPPMANDSTSRTRIVGAVPQYGEDYEAVADAFAKVSQKVSAFTAKAAADHRPASSPPEALSSSIGSTPGSTL